MNSHGRTPYLQGGIESIRRGSVVNGRQKRKIRTWICKIIVATISAIVLSGWIAAHRIALSSSTSNSYSNSGDAPATSFTPGRSYVSSRGRGSTSEEQINNPISTLMETDVSNLTFFCEPPTTLDSSNTVPLPRRTTSWKELSIKKYPKAYCAPKTGFILNFPVNDDELFFSDPFLPWIHDYFVTSDGSEVRFVAHNRRRCKTGEGNEALMKHWEPQISLFQPVPVHRSESHFRLSTWEEATAPETRFLCRFHDESGHEETTFSNFPIPYEYVVWRKHRGGSMFKVKGPDVSAFELAQLIFACPVPEQFRTHRNQARVDLIPIRTPARQGKWLLDERHIGPFDKDLKNDRFEPAREFGKHHFLPEIKDSGRIANLPLCKAEPQPKQHRWVLCTWTAASYHRRGNANKVEDSAQRLEEWITFHKIAGVDHIHVYDNTELKNDDDISPLLEIINRFPGFVTHHPWKARICSNNRPNHRNPGDRSSQYAAEASCRERYGPGTKWMSFIDTDEYLVPMINGTWKEFLDDIVETRPEVKVLKFRSTRGRPREELMEELPDQDKCKAQAREPRMGFDRCIVPRHDKTFLHVYNCDYIKSPRPERFARAMKQIYQPSFILSHFVHYATITADIARYYRDWKDPKSYSRNVKDSEWGDAFVDELTEGVLIHTKSVLPYETMIRSDRCQNGKQGCPVGRICPESTIFNDTIQNKSPFKDEKGNYCNCWVNQHVENKWVPLLEQALKELRGRM